MLLLKKKDSSGRKRPNFDGFWSSFQHLASHTLHFGEHCIFSSSIRKNGQPPNNSIMKSLIFWGTDFYILKGRRCGGGGVQFQWVLLICGQPFSTYSVFGHAQPSNISCTTYAGHPGDFFRPDLIVRSQEPMSLSPLENNGFPQTKICKTEQTMH